jgi:hypothetical protein
MGSTSIWGETTMENSIQAAATMSVEEWFDKYGVAILRRAEKRQRMAKLVRDLKAKAAAAGR